MLAARLGSKPRNSNPLAAAAWKAPAEPPGVGATEPTRPNPRTKIVWLIEKPRPKANNVSHVAVETSVQTQAVKKIVTARARKLSNTESPSARCLMKFNNG